MSRGDLQEMEVKTQQSKTAVNSGAAAADPMPTMADWVLNHQLMKILAVLPLRTIRPTMTQLS